MRFDQQSPARAAARQMLMARHRAWHNLVSRRKFLKAAVGASVLGGALGSRLLLPESVANGPGLGNVLPIPSTLNFFGVDIHVQAPPFSGADSDPATVWNFRGTSGIAFINTTATRIHRRTGVVQEDLDSSFNHMTFMQGVYRGRDGHVRDGTFALV